MTEQLDSLLQLITHLQDDGDTRNGQKLLLEYARSKSGARLALLLRLNEKQEKLHLLAQSGHHPRHAPSEYGRRHIPASLPLHGRFGAGLGTHGLQVVPDLYRDEQSLAEERSYAWPGGPVVVCSVGHGGLLVLCFAPQKPATTTTTTAKAPVFDEGDILICASLLSSYLSDWQTKPGDNRGNRHKVTVSSPLPRDETIIDRERERIARDIHDGPAQQFAAVLHRLEYAQRILIARPQDALHEIERARQLLNEGLHDLRQCITSLIPAPLQRHSLADALQAFEQDDGDLHIIVEKNNLSSLPPIVEVPVYRFVQEALNNVRKHAQARQAIVRVQRLPGMLHVEVRDDGKGFDSKTLFGERILHAGQHIGLRVMRERVREAGGTWEIQSDPGKGTIVRARFPLPLHHTSTPSTMPVAILTNRERDVLRLVIDGLTNRAIAEQLSVSTETVKTHVHHIMQKMNAKDRTHVAVLATRQHWV